MKYLLPILKNGTSLLLIIFLTSVVATAQEFSNGMRRGVIKVKFTSEMSQSLSQARIQTSKSGISTGITTLDAAAKKVSAKNIYRLFPYDPKFENKLRKHGLHLWYVVEIDEKTDPKVAVAQFKQLKEVKAAEVEREKIIAPFKVEPYVPGPATFDVLPFNDPLLKDQWHYNNVGQSGFGDADINLFEAWTKTAGANDIIVSVHDQGVDVNHVDLKDNIWVNTAEANGVAGVDDDKNGYVDDINGYNFERNKGALDPQYHGTHVAGTIAAVNNNGKGVSGVAGGTGHGDGVKIMSLQIFGAAPVEETYVYAANNGAIISQNSWGYSEAGYFEQSVLDAIDYFIAEAGDYAGSPMKGGIVIFAAGNSNFDADWYPGYHPTILSVAALGPEWMKAAYSNFGEWVEISAPGGDQAYGSKSGVLSTIPKDQYAYMQGTSMACPHVSGIAALALANRNRQLTNKELWNKLVTGVVNIDAFNGDYLGKLGSGAIDASLAIQNDLGQAPAGITDLVVTGISQEFATLKWSVPSDADDGKPVSFQLYYHTEAITPANLNAAAKVVIKNESAPGDEFSYEVNGLLGVTTYHFVLTATDRWGNVSILSNVVSKTTNDGPSIAVDENSQSISLDIDAASGSSATHDLTIINNASGILRWNHFMRHSNAELSFNAAGINYPKVSSKKQGSAVQVVRRAAHNSKNKLRSNEPVTYAFNPIEKAMASWPTDIIGETDTTLTNSALAKFFVNEPDGFNLTKVSMYMKLDPAKGPVIVEVYKGATAAKANLIYAQEYSDYYKGEQTVNINLNEQIYFESGSTFWIAVHVPSGNLFPLGIGFEDDAANSTNCYMSFNLGSTWIPLEEAINAKSFAWTMSAGSYNAYLGEYLTLEPGSGDIDGNSEATTTLTANAATLVNGSYTANLILSSNDAQKQELRIPVSLNVSGHTPNIRHIDIADYGSVFNGTSKTLDLVLENIGYGNFNNPEFSIDNPAFSIDGDAPWQIKALEEVTVRVKFTPASPGNANGTLNITNGDQTYQISLFGVGAETSKIMILPESQVINNVAIGDIVNAQVTVHNTGAYPLKYFVPGYDEKGVSENWPTPYHNYGYKFRTNYATEADPILYEFQDISSTGIDITEPLKDAGVYVTVDMGFDFPYYGQMMKTLYVAQKGFTTFDNSVRPINTPGLGNSYNPKGFISPLGTFISLLERGKVYYQVEADRVIVQYDNVWDGYNVGENIKAQMILYANGDIRFFYDDIQLSEQTLSSLTVLIEDLDQSDGVIIHDWEHPKEIYSGLAFGLDYPGPNIITHVENGSGIVAPGGSAIVDVEMSAASVSEGSINRYINFVSNDPSNATKNALVQLNVNSGGVPIPTVSTDTIAFGDVFQNDVRSSIVVIKNTGTSRVNVSNIAFKNARFNLVGESPSIIQPGLYKNYEVNMPTAVLGSLEDWLLINYADGSHDTVYVTGEVVVAPAINVDLSLLQEILDYGASSSHSFTVENTGLAPLEFVASGPQWMTFDLAATTAELPAFTYDYQLYNDGSVYQWIDIRKTGTQLPFMNLDEFETTFWRNLELPFPIEFYGKTYSSFKVGDNGIISFEDEPEASFFTDYIPVQSHPGACIMPYWTNSGFSDYLYPIEDIGIFYQAYDDKFVITWSYFVNVFGGMGDPVSAQVIFYKNGTMKFQYRAEEGGDDLTSRSSTIGLQENSQNGVSISAYQPLLHGKGLAYVVVPARKHVIDPGTTLSGYINIDAKNVYGGVYNDALKIKTNVPGSRLLSKPVELTVTGEAKFVAADTVDFGDKMIATEFGSPKVNYIEMNIENDGSAPFEITWAQMVNGTRSLSLMMLVDGWFGPEWTPIEYIYSPWAWETPTFKVMPGETLPVRAMFNPGTAGSVQDSLVLTTSIGEKSILLKGVAFEPPVINVDKDPIVVTLNTTSETADRSIKVDNINGKSDLQYAVSIDFGRAALSETAVADPFAKTYQSTLSFSSEKAPVSHGISTFSAYNRVIRYTDKETADGLAGTGGGAPLTIATMFNAGPEGFKLSHVESWIRTETLEDVVVKLEIRAGGSSIANAVKVGEGSLEFTGSGEDDAGAWRQIALNDPVGIYPNEDFYVIITLPLGIERPQGIIDDAGEVPGRYYYENEGVWSNIQDELGFETSGWLMYAAEETAGNSSWLTITSAPAGTIAAGNTSSVTLTIDGALAVRGDQIADIVIRSNDPKQAVVKVPVKLHMNEAPHFGSVPEGLLISEKEVKTVKISVTDKEGDEFTVVPAATYSGITHSFDAGVITIELKPDYGDEGSYSYTFIAKDKYNAESQVTLLVDVVHANRPPLYVGTSDLLEYYATGKLVEYELDDFFSDPDGDAIDFTVTSSNSDLVTVFASEEQFLVKPLSPGEATLEFTVRDTEGGVATKSVNIKVNVILGVDEDPNHGVQIWPNPVQKFANISLTTEWNGEVVFEIVDLSGRQHITHVADTKKSRDISINVTKLTKGFYILHAVSGEKRTSVKLIKE